MQGSLEILDKEFDFIVSHNATPSKNSILEQILGFVKVSCIVKTKKSSEG